MLSLALRASEQCWCSRSSQRLFKMSNRLINTRFPKHRLLITPEKISEYFNSPVPLESGYFTACVATVNVEGIHLPSAS